MPNKCRGAIAAIANSPEQKNSMAVKDKTGAKQQRKSAECFFWNCRKEAFASNSCCYGKNLPSRTAKQQSSEGQNGCQTTAKKCREGAVEKKLLHEFLLLLLILVAMGKTYPPKQKNGMAVKDRTGAKQQRKSAERLFWNCRKEAFAWVSATASNSRCHGKNLPSRTEERNGSEGQNGCQTTAKKCQTSCLKL